MIKEKKNVLDNNIDNRLNKNSSDKTRLKNYELFNVVSKNGDSIYSPHYEEFAILLDNDYEKGQVFVSEDKIREIVLQELNKRLGVLQWEK
jgi:hypothetical protein